MADNASTRLYVGNLLYQIQPEEVIDFFSSNGFTMYCPKLLLGHDRY